MVVAIDFDGVLDNESIQRLVRKLRFGSEIWIVTMRSDNEFNNNILKPVLDKLGISRFNVIFSSNKPKWEYLKAINEDIYIDNIDTEFETIKNHTNTIPLLWIN